MKTRSSRLRRGDVQLLYTWLRVLGLATIAHVYLPDYDQAGWLVPRIIGLAGGVGLILASRHPSSVFHRDYAVFLMMTCLILASGKVYTLLGLRDVLTQSLLLLCFYLLGAWGLWRPQQARSCLRGVVWCASLTYGLAVLHKLNADFLHTPQSCAIHGVEISLSLLDDGEASGFTHQLIRTLLGWAKHHPTAVASGVLGLEFSLALLCLRHSRWMWVWGSLFHLPLTLTIAPAFGSVMAAGWGAGTLLGPPLIRFDRVQTHVTAQPVIWVVCFYGVHGLSPYIGVEFQHSAAMLSNLRVDPACANSVVMPRTSYDPYIYIDEVRFGSRSLPRREMIVRETLWNLSALHTMRRNWCIPENQPLTVKGSYARSPLIINNLCAPGALDQLSRDALFPSGWQRYQKNLSRTCHAECVH